MKITVETVVKADLDTVWRAWNAPDDIRQWNAASDDWHTTASAVDLREGGRFSARMEAKDGSVGFDFEGTYTRIVPRELIAYAMGDGRQVTVRFARTAEGVLVRETFDAESENDPEMQRRGWQAILDRFAAHVEARDADGASRSDPDSGTKTTRVRVESFTVSLDGYGAGPHQDLDNPLGVGGEDLHQWFRPTRTFRRIVLGAEDGTTGIDDDFAARGFRNVGAWILGRNMFGPVRGPWPDMNWKGWWGDNPPYHVPVFVLTHHARPSLPMEGGTTFHFVTGGIHEALERARDAAGGMDVRIGGGPGTIRQYLRAALVDELHLAIAPVLLGGGEPLFQGLDLKALGYACVQSVASEKATHVVLRRLER